MDTGRDAHAPTADDRRYEPPALTQLGSVEELTQAKGGSVVVDDAQ